MSLTKATFSLINGAPLNVLDFGAVGDGIADDTAAIQAAINAGAGQSVGTAKAVYFPAGDYYISAPITVPNYTTIFGDGIYKSRINLQGKPYAGHVFTNADPVTWGWFTLRDFSVRGGSYAILNSSGSQESWFISDVAFEIQTIAGIRSDVNFQVNTLRNVSFYFCAHAIIIASGFMNMNNFDTCDFAGIANQSILAIGGSCEVNNFTGCRFEAGGVATRSTIYTINARNTSFTGCYFEATHDFLLLEGSASGTVFNECHFTGALGALSPYIFSSDNVVQFGTNTWGATSEGPTQMMVLGDNQNKLGKNNQIVGYNCKQKANLVGTSTSIAVGSTAINTVTLSRIFTSATLTDNTALFGDLKVIVQQILSGGFSQQLIVTIPVFATITGSGSLGITFGTSVINKDTTGAVVTVVPSVTGPSTITITVTGVPGTLDNGFAAWEFDSFSGANPTFNPITVDFS